jgi:ketosteroid isomerase-like protein
VHRNLMKDPILVAAASAALFFLASSTPQNGQTIMAFQETSSKTLYTSRAVVDRFNEAFNRHDAVSVSDLLTEDTVFEDTSPAPDGRRIEGKTAVAEFWRVWFERNPGAHFEAEEVIVSGDRVVVRWVYRKLREGKPWHLRGIDVFTVRDGKIAAKLAYVKG